MKSKITACVILIATAFIFYGNSISNKFALDDLIVITGNSFTQKGISGLKDIFTHDSFVGAYGGPLKLSGGRYRPLSIATFAIEKSIFGVNSTVFHFINVLFFAITLVIIFLFLCRLFSSDKLTENPNNYNLPFISTFIFAILPVHTEVVANIKSCDEILALLLSVGAFLLLLPKEKNKTGDKKNKPDAENNSPLKITSITGSSIIFFLALLAKENVITFLALIPLGLFLFTNDSAGRIAVKTVPLVFVSIIYLFMRAQFAGVIGDRQTADIMDFPYLHATFVQKLATISLIQLRYIVLMIFPYQLSYDYSYNQIPLVNFTNPFSLLSIIIHGSLLIYALRVSKKNKIVSYFILFYFITYSIVSNLFFNIGTSMAERFTYMPSLSISVLIAFLLMRALKINFSGTPSLKIIPLAVLLLIMVFAAAKTIARNKEWLDNYSLFKADINKVPDSARSHLYFGIECYRQFEKNNNSVFVDTSIAHLKKSIEINPLFYYSWLNLGVVCEHTEKYSDALVSYKNVVNLEPQNEQAIYGVGYVYGKGLNKPDSAIPYFKKLIDEMKLTKPQYFEGLGNCYSAKNNFSEAIRFYKEGFTLNPSAARLYFNTGIAYGQLGKLDSSDLFFNKAFELDPSLKQQ